MQASKNELFILNWEICNLTNKLQNFADDYHVMDLGMVNVLNSLITTIDFLLCKVSCEGGGEWDKEDQQIRQGYYLHHSINCKMCRLAIKIARPSLLRHLKECRSTVNAEVSETALATPNKSKSADETCQTNVINTNLQCLDSKHTLSKTSNDSPSNDSKERSNKMTIESKLKNPESKEKKEHPKQTAEKTNSTPRRQPDKKFKLSRKTGHFVTRNKPLTIIKKAKAVVEEMLIYGAHDNIIKDLEELFRPTYPAVKAYTFGSRVTRLGTENSDVDIYLDLEGNYEGSKNYTKDEVKFRVVLTKDHLKLSDQWTSVSAIIHARTPIVRALHIKEQITCDISITHGLSHCNTKLIKYLLQLQPVCYNVALYVKEWSQFIGIGALKTYTKVLLVIFFFQIEGLLPAIYTLQNSCENPMFICGWQANFEEKPLHELGIPEISELLTEEYIVKFFAFYGNNFDFATQAICPFMGCHLSKKVLDPTSMHFPKEYISLKNYYKNFDREKLQPQHEFLAYKNPMVVQDPLELNHNVAKSINPSDVERFRKHCAQTANEMFCKKDDETH